MAIVYRSQKNSELTWLELDGNFSFLDDKIDQVAAQTGSAEIVRVTPQVFLPAEENQARANIKAASIDQVVDLNDRVDFIETYNPVMYTPQILLPTEQQTARDNIGAIGASELSNYIPVTQKGSANGVATLDANSKIPANQIPAVAITDTFVVANQTQMLALTVQAGDVAIRTDLNKTFILQSEPASTLANWKEVLTPASGVQSVSMTAPTGMTVTGSPITNTGTFVLSFATGYSLPTTAKQANWDASYSWGNHASAGYLKSVSWGEITGKPSTFPPSAHTHAISDITNLQFELTAIKNDLGNKTNLTTTDKTNLVNAINEVKSVGDFRDYGLANIGISSGVVDIDDIGYNCFVRLADPSNVFGGYGSLINLTRQAGSDKRVGQIAILTPATGTEPSIKMRSRSGSGWTPVRDFFHSGNFDPSNYATTNEVNNIYDQLSAKANTRLSNVVSDLSTSEKNAIKDKLGVQDPISFSGSASVFINGGSIQRRALTGDVTAADNSNITTISNNAVSNAKLAQVNGNTLKGKSGAASGNPQDLTPAQVRSMLNVAEGANNYVLPQASVAERGGFNLFSNAVQTAAPNAVTNNAGYTYAVQVNSDGQAVVNVPHGSGGYNPSFSSIGSNQIVDNAVFTISKQTNFFFFGSNAPNNVTIEASAALLDCAEVVIHCNFPSSTNRTIKIECVTPSENVSTTLSVSGGKTYSFKYSKSAGKFFLVGFMTI